MNNLEEIDLGFSPDDGLGDDARVGGEKINAAIKVLNDDVPAWKENQQLSSGTDLIVRSYKGRFYYYVASLPAITLLGEEPDVSNKWVDFLNAFKESHDKIILNADAGPWKDSIAEAKADYDASADKPLDDSPLRILNPDNPSENGHYKYKGSENDRVVFQKPFFAVEESGVVQGSEKLVKSGDVYDYIEQNKEEDVVLIAMQGQSNMGGRVPISEASSEELLPQEHLSVWNDKVQDFVPLDIPVNNQSGYNKYGVELPFIYHAKRLYPNKKLYLVKFHVGNTQLSTWLRDGENNIKYELAFIKPAIKKLESMNKKVHLTYFIHQGEANNSLNYGNEFHLNQLRQKINELREDYATNLPVVFGEIESSRNSINSNFHTVVTEFDNVSVVDMEGESTIDGIHFDDAAIRKLGKGYLEKMPLKLGAFVDKQIVPTPYYLVRTKQTSVVSSGSVSLLLDLEWLNIGIGVTEFWVDGENKYEFTTPTISGTQLIVVPGVAADGTTKNVVIKNAFLNMEVSFTINVPSSSVEQNTTIDFSGYTVPATDVAKFEEWYGSYEINTSPEGSKALHLVSDTGGVSTNNYRTVRLKNVSHNNQSINFSFDYALESASISQCEGWVYLKAIGGSRSKGYLLRLRANRIFLYKGTNTGVSILVGSGVLPSLGVNTFRNVRVEMNGFSFKIYYTKSDSTEELIIDYRITFPISLEDKSDEVYLEGTVLLGASGVNDQGVWYKNINIIT